MEPDADGYEDIETVEFEYNKAPISTVRWVLLYTVATDTFSESGGTTSWVEILQDICSVDKSTGNELDITFGFRLEWIHPETGNGFIDILVTDDDAGYDFERVA